MKQPAPFSAPAIAPFYVSRRRFLQTASTGLALSTLGAYGADLVNQKPKRVGLIGAGWYGKSDLWRLVQVAPVEIVAMCDPDTQMLAGAVAIAQQRQKSQRAPRTFKDYREMLKQEQFDIVLVGSPDHWHALHAIAAIEAGADVYLQKPISVDVLEGEVILAAARRHRRVVQIGTQRKSTPHLMDAKRQVIDAGLLGKIAHVELCCYYGMRANGNPPVQAVPDHLDYDLWTGPAPLRPYDGLPHRRWWRTFMEYGNGIVGDMCVHMLDTAQWMLGLGWPKRISSTGGIYVQKDGKSNIADTQTAVFEFEGLNAVWQHRTWGTPPDPDYPWALFIYGEKGVRGAGHAAAHAGFPGRDRKAQPAGGRCRVGPHLHRELHSGQHGDEARPALAVRPGEARSDRGPGGEQAPGPRLSGALAAAGGGVAACIPGGIGIGRHVGGVPSPRTFRCVAHGPRGGGTPPTDHTTLPRPCAGRRKTRRSSPPGSSRAWTSRRRACRSSRAPSAWRRWGRRGSSGSTARSRPRGLRAG
jgi:predicted dehydrogenase